MYKYLVMDIDGTLTDGKIYMGPQGEAMKAFSVKDGYVFKYILEPAQIIPVVITARNSSIVKNRCDELGIKEVYQGKLDKLAALKEIVGEQQLSSCVYFGDDILDLKCMMPIKNAGGIIGCPADAVQEVKAVSDYICLCKAGDGALREFVEWLVCSKCESEASNKIEAALEYLKKLKISESDIGCKKIVDDSFYYMVQSYKTRPVSESKLESHRKYVDIQIIVKGKEAMDIVDISRLSTVEEQYNDDADVMFWKPVSTMMQTVLREGDYIVLYPEHAHRGSILIDEAENVIKIVGKVKVS